MKRLLATVILSLTTMMSWAGTDTQTDANDVILAGHDTVAYHTEGKPVLGKPELTAVHNGAIYRFSSKKNRNLFSADPDKYAPAYGGYCALGASFGKKFKVDGKAFEVVNGQLYVNKNLGVYKSWRKDIPGNIVKADKNWPNISAVPAKDL